MDNKRKQIIFTYDDVEYTLEFTADSLKRMERNGFKFGKMDEIVLTAPIELFCGAFESKHRKTPRKLREEIFNQLAEDNENGQALTEVLGDMLSQAIEELNSHQGNVKWSILN